MITFPNILVSFYQCWHGKLHLKGAGYLIRKAAIYCSRLRDYPLLVPKIGYVNVDLSDVSGMAWLNYSLGEEGQEEGLLSLLETIVPSPKCIWEVGANGGYFAAQILVSFPELERLYLFEPNPAMIQMLDAVAKSRAGISVSNFAFSNTDGEAKLSFQHGNSSMASLLDSPNSSQVNVVTKTGDTFLAMNPEAVPDVIIIDVEGAEKSVLQGMKRLLDTHQPLVIFEQIFFDPGILDPIMPDSYKRFTIDDKSGALIQGFHVRAGYNGVFICSSNTRGLMPTDVARTS